MRQGLFLPVERQSEALSLYTLLVSPFSCRKSPGLSQGVGSILMDRPHFSHAATFSMLPHHW